MLQFQPEHFDALGAGVFIPDGDTLYITNGEWLLVVTGCEHHIPIEILRVIANSENALVDWRILGAREIYEEEGKYLPYRGPQSVDMYTSRYGKYATVTPESVRGLLEKNTDALWGDCYRVDQLFAAGRARTKYVKEDVGERRKFSSERAAQHHAFDLDGRILTVGADYMRCFYDLGFNITCPTRLSGPPKVLGLYMRDVVPDIFGYLAPTLGTGIKTSPDGREMLIDPGEASWYSVEEGAALLCDPLNYDAGYHRQATESARSSRKELMLGVSSLRWHGVPEEEIDRIYAGGRSHGLAAQIPELIDRARRAVSAYEHSKDQWRERSLAEAISDLREIQSETGMIIPDDLTAYLGM